MPVLPVWFPAAAQLGLRNIYELGAERFSPKEGPFAIRKGLSFSNLRVA
jgi:hypothetical protein